MNYYNLEGIDRSVATSAGTIEKVVAGTERDLVKGLSKIPFRMVLDKISFKKGEMIKSKDFSDLKVVWTDYLPNQFVWPMMSERMKNIVEQHLTGEEGIEWIEAPVEGNFETIHYYVPRFSRFLDVLDKIATKYMPNGETVSHPCFSAEKISNLSMFFSRPTFWEIPSSLVVNEPLMKALKKAKLTGIGFSPARSS